MVIVIGAFCLLLWAVLGFGNVNMSKSFLNLLYLYPSLTVVYTVRRMYFLKYLFNCVIILVQIISVE